MDQMPLDRLKLANSPKEPTDLALPPVACPTHQPVMHEEGQRPSLFEHVQKAAMACTVKAAPPEYAITGQMDDGDAVNRAAVELMNQARESYFRQAPQAERDEHEESMRNTRALMTDAGDRVDDVVGELTELLNQARESYFSNAPQAERDEHEQNLQRLRSMSDAEIVADLSKLRAQYLPKV